jgi:predicted DNA binding CopG/RHH family protein
MLARKVWLPKQIGVRLDDRLIALVQQRADDDRMSVSRYVRTLIEREVTRDLLKDQHDGQG